MTDSLARVLVDVAGDYIKIVTDGADKLLGMAAKLRNVAGTIINPSTEDTLASIKDTDGVKKITDALPAGTNNIGEVNAVLHNPEGDPIGHESGEPVFVSITAPEDREFLAQYAIAGDTPAELASGNSEPFDIGGQTLTLTVNGTSDNHTFPTTTATKGVTYSGQNPALNNPDQNKMKLRVDGGAEGEVEISKDLGSPEAIASALQTAIRATIANGTDVIVEYSPSDYPGRYVIRSGTTGASSSVWIKKDDHLDEVLKLSTAYGGTQRDGLAANYYYADEAAESLGGGTAGVDVRAVDGEVHIETIATGSSATLLVGSGGANTALGFPTTTASGTTGTQSNDLNVDGSSANVPYSIVSVSGYKYNIQRIVFLLRNDDIQLKEFGGIVQLTNGILIRTRTAGGTLREWFTAKTNSELIALSTRWDLMDDAYAADGKDLLVCKIEFSEPMVIRPDSQESITILVRDNLTSLDSFQVRAEGWLEAV